MSEQSISSEMAPVTSREPFTTDSRSVLFSPEGVASPTEESPLDAENDIDDAPWCSRTVLFPVAVATLAGCLLGIVIAFTPLFFVFNGIDSDCTGLTGRTACESTKFSECVWLNHSVPASATNGWKPGSCVFPSYLETFCPSNASQDACVNMDGCTYNFAASMCTVTHGWTAAQSGIFAGFFVLSAIFTPVIIPPLLSRVGYRPIQVCMGIVVLVGALLTNIGRASSNNFGVLVAGRIVLGVAIGSGFVVGNTYPAEMAPKKKMKSIPPFLTLSIPTSILVVSLIGFAIQPRDLENSELKTEERIHGLTVIFWVIGVLEILVGLMMPESRVWLEKASQPASENEATVASLSNFVKSSWKMIIVSFFLFMPAVGINAVYVFTALINDELIGADVLLASWIFSAFGAAAAPFAPIASSRMSSPKLQFVLGNIICGLLLVVAGISSMPSVGASDNTRAILVAIALLGYVCSYQPLGGPAVFLVCIRLWDPMFISLGMSCGSMLINVWGFFGSTIFPIMVEGISGGPDEDQKVGMSITLLILGLITLLSAGVVHFFAAMKPSLDVS